VRRHGRDSLSFFKLRGDAAYLFDDDGTAFLAYRVEGRVLVVSGDPVGPEEAIPGLVRDLFALAEEHGLRVCVLGAGEALLPVYRAAGLRAMYIGDEALVDTDAFSLEGRPIRKVRQSVTRLEKAGYRITVEEVGDLGPGELAELERVSVQWRDGAAERGFTMCMDVLGGEQQSDSMVMIARDADGEARGFLHFVPCYGRPAMSLSAMRRDPDTPNGLTEYLVARSLEALRERGISEVSLNFATFARWLHAPRNRMERWLGRVVRRLNPYFQIESLYRFNAKFFPRWEPRYMCFEGLGLMRAGLAALWAEGQIPRLPGSALHCPERATAGGRVSS
jgi:lysyl-tRNA synthetase class 2